MNFEKWKTEYLMHKNAYLGYCLYRSWKKPQGLFLQNLYEQMEKAGDWDLELMLDDFLEFLMLEPTIVSNHGITVLGMFECCCKLIKDNYFRLQRVEEIIDTYDLRKLIEDKISALSGVKI